MTEIERQNKINELRLEYAKIQDAKMVLAHMSSICDNTSYLATCLNTSVNNVKSITSNFTLPGYIEVFDRALSPLESNGVLTATINTCNSELSSEISKVGPKLDEKMTNIANQISYYQNVQTASNDGENIILGITG